jgi:hypothetical protein
MGQAQVIAAADEALAAAPTSRVLTLSGNGNYLELPLEPFKGLKAATLECWVQWHSFAGNEHVFEFDATKRVKVGNKGGTADLEFLAANLVPGAPAIPRIPKSQPGDNSSPSESGQNKPASVGRGDDDITTRTGPLRLHQWHHLAVSFDENGTKLYLDGALVGRVPYADGIGAVSAAGRRLIGACSVNSNNSFRGQFKEVRLWRSVRSEEQIRENLNKELNGTEPELIGLWNFADQAQPGRDATPNGHHGTLKIGAPVARAGALPAAPFPSANNRVLELDGSSFVELPANIIQGLDEVTVESWVRWDEFRAWSRIFSFGQGDRRLCAMNSSASGFVWAAVDLGRTAGELDSPGVLSKFTATAGQWVHVAVVAGKDGMALYVNGDLAGKEQRARISDLRGDGENRLGAIGNRDGTETLQALRGAMDEVRVWKTARTEEQIRENLLRQLTGNETGLVGLWNFDDPTNPGRDASANHHDGKLMGNALTAPVASAGVASQAGNALMATVSGRLVDAEGNPVRGAVVRLMQGESTAATTRSNESGEYFFLFARNAAPYRVFASLGKIEAESAESEFVEGSIQRDLTLRDTLRIAGILSDSEGQPRRGVKIEAVGANGAVAAFSVSDAYGSFILRRLPDGEFKLRAAGVDLNGGKAYAVGADAAVTNLSLTLPAIAEPMPLSETNRVLTLDGSGSHVALPVGMFSNLQQSTVEAWVRFASLKGLQRFFNYGTMGIDFYIGKLGAVDLNFGTFHPQNANGRGHDLIARGVLEEGRWCHVAVVIDTRETRLYFNGALTGTDQGASSFADLHANSPASIGQWSDGATFLGKIDEVRVWATARSGDEIRAGMFQRLKGREGGLAALWNFDDPNKPGKDATLNGFDGEVVKNAAVESESIPSTATEITPWASLSGAAVDVDVRPLNKVRVRVERGAEHTETETDVVGNFSIFAPASSEPWRVTATRGDLSATPVRLALDPGDHMLNLTLRDAAPLSGNLQSPDGRPLPTVVVQALPVGRDGDDQMAPGLVAEIFNVQTQTDFPVIPESTAPVLRRIDSEVEFPLVNDSVASGNAEVKNPMYARWKGRIRIGQKETTHFISRPMTLPGCSLMTAKSWNLSGPVASWARRLHSSKTTKRET